MKTAIDACAIIERLTCSQFYDPSLIILLQKSLYPLFYSVLAGITIYISMVFFYILLKKGLSITVSGMNRRYFANILTVCILSYIISSSYYVFGSSSPYLLIATGELIAVFNIILIIFAEIGIIQNIRKLHNLASNMLNLEMNEIRRGIKKKIIIYEIFGILIIFYYCWGAIYMAVLPFLQITDRKSEYFGAINSGVTLFTILIICIIFHPCYFTAAFQLGQIELEENYEQNLANQARYIPVPINLTKLNSNENQTGLLLNQKKVIIIRPIQQSSDNSIFYNIKV